MKKVEINSEIEVTLKMIGGKYKPYILYLLATEGTKRFMELMSLVNKISQKTLTNQLREMEQDMLISRKSYNIIPPRVEYSITEKGKTLLPILDLMCEWGEKNMDERFLLLNPPCSHKQ